MDKNVKNTMPLNLADEKMMAKIFGTRQKNINRIHQRRNFIIRLGQKNLEELLQLSNGNNWDEFLVTRISSAFSKTELNDLAVGEIRSIKIIFV